MVRAKILEKLLKDIFPKNLRPIPPSKETYDILKRMILTGKLKKGRKLVQRKVAKELKISEIVARKAFEQLRKDGLIETRHGAGSIIR